MFNFKSLKIIKSDQNNSTSSFVGIRRGADNQLEFSLPRGFKEFPEMDFNSTKNLFFKMYKTFKKFEKNQIKKTPDKNPAGKDNTETLGNAYAFKDSNDNDVILYSKISVIEKMLDAYKDLSLDIIEKSTGKSDYIDYKKIDNYLDKAIYLDNDAIYIDEMSADVYVLHYQPNSLINLFCFIIRELQNEMENPIEVRINELASIFVDHNLSHDQSLFEEESFESTVATLKDILHYIDKSTAYKDSYYWQLFEAIESFLYGELNMENVHEDGIFWGINNFFQIWEDMCNTYAFSNFSIAYADTNIIHLGERVGNFKLNGHSLFKLDNLDYPFFVEFRDEIRWMRPDVVIFNNDKEKNNIFDKEITIIKRKNYGDTADYEIRLNNTVAKKTYQAFIKLLKMSKHSGYGTGSTKSMIFRNYSTAKLERAKKFTVDKDYIKSNVISKATIIDWKYKDLPSFYNSSNRLEADISKQLCYEHCLLTTDSLQVDAKVDSWFAIPYFYSTDSKSVIDYEPLQNYEAIYPRLQKNGIQIYKFNFSVMQKTYINDDQQSR